MALLELALQGQSVINQYVVQPILILLLGVFIGKVLEQVILFIGGEFASGKRSPEALAYTVAWVVYILTIGYALASIHLLVGVLWFALGVLATIILIAVVLGGRDFLINFLGFRAAQKKCKPGAEIVTRFGTGTVVNVMLLETHIKSKSGDDIYIPNGTIRSLKIEKA